MTIRVAVRSAALTVGVAAVVAGLATPADAGDQFGDQFGDHVKTCAQTMGFDGVHNPGMHEGYSGWNPDHTC